MSNAIHWHLQPTPRYVKIVGVNREVLIAASLRDVGLRKTPVRVAVMEAVISSKKPLAAPQIIRRLGGETDSVTVYRTLNTLAEHRLLHRVRGEDGAWRYAADVSAPGAEPGEHSHAHFVCDECGTVECLQRVTVPEDLVRSRDLGRRYDVTYAELVVHGVCPRCHD
jgi:Fur family ferric uptake transcriptional regulator